MSNVSQFVSPVLLVGALILAPRALSQEAAVPKPSSSCTLVIHAVGFRNEKGGAGGAVFSSPEGWPEDLAKAYHHGDFAIRHNESTLTFPAAPGHYAIVVIHDENINHKMDRNFLGLPKEGYGFANNPHVRLTAPSFRAASVQVTCPVTETTIRIHYWGK